MNTTLSSMNYQPSKLIATDTVFDPDYVPLLASEREARRGLLYPWKVFMRRGAPQNDRNKILTKIDPYVARELHRQEVRDKELRDIFAALFGSEADWHEALLLEGLHNDCARRELSWRLTELAITGAAEDFAQYGHCDGGVTAGETR